MAGTPVVHDCCDIDAAKSLAGSHNCYLAIHRRTHKSLHLRCVAVVEAVEACEAIADLAAAAVAAPAGADPAVAVAQVGESPRPPCLESVWQQTRGYVDVLQTTHRNITL